MSQFIDFSSPNARPIAIFSGYMATAAALTAACIWIIASSPSPSSRQDKEARLRLAKRGTQRSLAKIAFTGLAILSLATTWYYMFVYFGWSYADWAKVRAAQNPLESHEVRLGDWLRDTKLFKQAWSSTLTTQPRQWWSLQIFGFCASWSITLAVQAKKRPVPHAWVFMLLGQIVAISFAMNLSFIAAIAREDGALDKPAQPAQPAQPATDASKDNKLKKDTASKDESKKESEEEPLSLLSHIFLGVNVGLALLIPANLDSPAFTALLIAPHVLAFLPLCLDRLGIADASIMELSPLVKLWSQLSIVAFASRGIIQSWGDWEQIGNALYEHPAVSSVGWDVICCWLTSICWTLYSAI